MKKKLLFVSHSSEKAGGAEDELEKIIDYLISFEGEYEIHTIFPEGYRKEYFINNSDKYLIYERCHLPVTPNKILDYYGFLKSYFKQKKLITKFTENKEYDVCIFNVSVLIWPMLVLRRYKNIVFVREDVNPKFIKKILHKILKKIAAYVIFVSKGNEQEFKENTKFKNTETLFSSVEEYVNINEDYYFRNIDPKIGKKIKSQEIKLCCMGTITARKNQLSLIKAIKYIKDNNNNNSPLLFLAGDNEIDLNYYLKCKKFIDENNLKEDIIFTGHLNKNDYYSLLNNIDILLIPSTSEGFPLVLSAALKYGKPIIATKVGGIEDIIINNINGILMNDTKPKTISDAISIIMKNNHFRDELIRNAIKTYKEYFSLNENLTKIKGIIDDISGK